MDLKTNSRSPWDDPSPISATRIAAAHNAQMEAVIAAVRADSDAKVAELMADLEGTRGEKEKADTELAYLKASTRKERLLWNKERTVLTRRLAETEARAREKADGVASPEEFVALQKGLATRDEIIEGLHRSLRAKEAAYEKLQFEADCDSTREEDLDRLMVRVASLEQALAEESDARKAAQEKAESTSAENRGLERRLAAAMAAAVRAEDEAVTCAKDAAKAMQDVREARTSQRQAELWLEKSLAEVDAVHAILECSDRDSAAAATAAAAGPVSRFAVVEPSAQSPHPPSPDFVRARFNSGNVGHNDHLAVGPGAQTPHPPSPTAIRRGGGRSAEGGSPPGGDGQVNVLRTPDKVDATMPVFFSASTRLRSRAEVGAHSKHGSQGEENDNTLTPDDSLQRNEKERAGSRNRYDSLSPPTPTVLFGDMAMEGRGAGAQVGSSLHGNESVSSSYDRVYLPLNGVKYDSGSANGTTTPKARMDGSGMTPHHQRSSSNGNGDRFSGGNYLDQGAPQLANGKSRVAADNMKAASLLVWHSFLLRYEMSRREKAEARATELEAAFQRAADETSAASKSDSRPFNSNAHESHLRQAGLVDTTCDRSCSCQKQKGCCCGACGRGGNHSLALPGERCASISGVTADCYAHFVRTDLERQKGKILELVREARVKMGFSKREIGDGFGGRTGAAAGGSLSVERIWPNTECSNPSDEVASLIQHFESTLEQSNDANAQLRDFCTHLEGLLAAHGHDRRSNKEGTPSFGSRSSIDSIHAAAITPFKCRKGVVANSKHDINHPGVYGLAALQRRGSPLPRPYQELC